MKLLFDQNLSPVLVEELHDLFPGSAHTAALGLARADDSSVWEYARENGFAIVTKDADFSERGSVWIASQGHLDSARQLFHGGDRRNLAAQRNRD